MYSFVTYIAALCIFCQYSVEHDDLRGFPLICNGRNVFEIIPNFLPWLIFWLVFPTVLHMPETCVEIHFWDDFPCLCIGMELVLYITDIDNQIHQDLSSHGWSNTFCSVWSCATVEGVLRKLWLTQRDASSLIKENAKSEYIRLPIHAQLPSVAAEVDWSKAGNISLAVHLSDRCAGGSAARHPLFFFSHIINGYSPISLRWGVWFFWMYV